MLAVTVAAVVYVLPTWYPDLWPHTRINLGLDLQGGMHLVLEVDTEKAVKGTTERIVEELRDFLRKDRIRFSTLEMNGIRRFTVTVRKDQEEGARKILDTEYPNLAMVKEEDTDQGGHTWVMELTGDEVDDIKRYAAAQALETIRNRVDEFGLSEPDIRTQGERRILIQLPGIKDTERAKKMIGQTAMLEFKLVDDTADPAAAEKGSLPPGDELLYQIRVDKETRRETGRIPFVVKKRTPLTGASLSDARVNFDPQYNKPYVAISFDKKGARDFKRITGENVGKRLAIVLDGKVSSAPEIQEEIGGGEARITGNFTPTEARDLATVLRAGALPAPVEILEERTVGPSLGADSIRQGVISMAVGGAIVVLFMMLYYAGAGIVADLALVLNILLIAAGLAAFGATLTLPGIAGIILTIGMAVDANVLIFERIREEQRVGKTPHAAMSAGYNRATLTILDANVTTLIAALVLFQFGTGPVRGFAVTLSLGVVSSLFTALFVTRIVFDTFLVKFRIKKLSI